MIQGVGRKEAGMYECILFPWSTSASGAVLFEALSQGVSDKVDTVIVDTSGRLSNNDALTQELVKMKKTDLYLITTSIHPKAITVS